MCRVIHHGTVYHSENLGASYRLSSKKISEINYCRAIKEIIRQPLEIALWNFTDMERLFLKSKLWTLCIV